MKKFFFFIFAFGAIVCAKAESVVLLDEPFSESFGSFTLDEQKYAGCTYNSMWYVDKNYKYAKITANQGGVSKGASDCKLISPKLDAAGASSVILRFEHTTYAASSTADVDYCMVKVSSDGINWQKLTIPIWPSKRWNFVACEMDLSAYASGELQVMFQYVSTASYAGTWEVKNVQVEATWTDAAPACSYEHLEGLCSADLREQLHEEISKHKLLAYEDIRADKVQVDVRADGKLWDIYSACDFELTMFQPKNYTVTVECDKYNREHMLPKSWWGYKQETEKTDTMYSDLHHVISVDGMANTKRSAWVYDEVKSVTWSNSLGSKLGTGKTWNETAFEPVDEYKGDVARVYFYMLTCYMDKDFTAGGKGYRYFTYSNGVSNFNVKSLALMLKWHRQDPVSEREINRNAKVKALQGNDNPFVVEPNLVEYIWGTMKAEAYDCDAEVKSPDAGTVDGAITCQEARDMALALSSGSQSAEEYVVVGYVTSLNGAYNTQYGSQTFWVADEKGSSKVFYAYQCYADSAVVVGDKVSLTGKLLNYNGTPEMKWGRTAVLLPVSAATDLQQVECMDWTGAVVYTLTGQKLSIEQNQLPAGIYILRQGNASRVVVR